MEDVGKWRNRAANPITIPFACMRDKCYRNILNIRKYPWCVISPLLSAIIIAEVVKGLGIAN